MKEGSDVWVEAGKNSVGKAVKISARHTFTAAMLNQNYWCIYQCFSKRGVAGHPESSTLTRKR